jgi:hypothetical protein
MESFFKPLQEEGNRTEEERQRMRGVLQQYAVMKPIRALQPAAMPAGIFRVSATWMWAHRNVAVAALVVAFLAGGTSYAAEGSLPGDLLYPVKVGVNEKIHGVFAVGLEADADWDLELAHRRAQEIVALAQQNKLNDEARADLETKFDMRIHRYTASVEAFGEKGDEKTAERLTEELTMHLTKLDGLLKEVNSEEEVVQNQVKQFRAKVESHLDVSLNKKSKKPEKDDKKEDKTSATPLNGEIVGTLLASTSVSLGTSTSNDNDREDEDEEDGDEGEGDDPAPSEDEDDKKDDKKDEDKDDQDDNAQDDNSNDDDNLVDFEVEAEVQGASVDIEVHL